MLPGWKATETGSLVVWLMISSVIVVCGVEWVTTCSDDLIIGAINHYYWKSAKVVYFRLERWGA